MADQPVAIVTGAAGGIGAATGAALAEQGYLVIGTSRRAATAAPVAGVTMVDLDVADDASVARVVDNVIADHGRIDLLVNNAGIGSAGAAEESSIEQARHIFDVNVFGTMRMINAVLPQMRRQGSGRVINVSSVLGLMPAPFMALYAATKHALEGYSESLDHEVREYGVRVLLVEPFYTRTAFEANAVDPDRPLDVYDDRRTAARSITARGVENGDAPAVVAAAIAAAATGNRPPVRHAAGPSARRVSLLRRYIPAAAFDQQIRKLNRLPATR